MTKLVLIGSNCEAFGHPTECTEPAPGEVVSTSNSSVSINGVDVATSSNADINFPNHSHDYSSIDGCHEESSHTLSPQSSSVSPSITINGSPVYLERDGVADDPITGGSVNITSSGDNTTVDQR